MKQSVQDYIVKLKGTPAATAAALRDLIVRTAPGLRESIKRRRPVYEAAGTVCYFEAEADHVALGFWHGEKLRALSPRLEACGHGRALLRLFDPADVDVAEVSALIDAAIRFGEQDRAKARAEQAPAEAEREDPEG